MASWRCRFGFHDWVYIVEKTKVSVGSKYYHCADYRICSVCELVSDV